MWARCWKAVAVAVAVEAEAEAEAEAEDLGIAQWLGAYCGLG